jgi:hypothetical protein
MQRLPQELASEGALAALRLITEVNSQSVAFQMVRCVCSRNVPLQRLPQLAMKGALAALTLISVNPQCSVLVLDGWLCWGGVKSSGCRRSWPLRGQWQH